MVDDAHLARRSILGFGEMLATLGRWGAGEEAVVRRPDALGARIDMVPKSPWYNAAVVPAGVAPPTSDDPQLPHCLWAVAEVVAGRVEDVSIAMPCMGLALDDPALTFDGGSQDAEAPSLALVGDLNDRAYDDVGGAFGPLVRSLRDERIRTYGLSVDGVPVCVAMTLTIGDDVCVHYVAVEVAHRRRGLARRLLLAVLAEARAQGLRTATLQASPDGRSVYERLGFRHVALLRAHRRPPAVG